MIHSGHRLLGTQAKGSHQAEHGGEYRQDVDDMAGPAPHALSQQRVEDGPYAERQALVKGKQRQRERHNGINGPRV